MELQPGKLWLVFSPSADKETAMSYQFIRLEFVSAIVRHQTTEKHLLRFFPVSQAVVTMVF